MEPYNLYIDIVSCLYTEPPTYTQVVEEETGFTTNNGFGVRGGSEIRQHVVCSSSAPEEDIHDGDVSTYEKQKLFSAEKDSEHERNQQQQLLKESERLISREESERIQQQQLKEESEHIQQQQLKEESERIQQQQQKEESEHIQQQQLKEESERIQQQQQKEESEHIQQQQLKEESERIQQQQQKEESERIQQQQLKEESERIQQQQLKEESERIQREINDKKESTVIEQQSIQAAIEQKRIAREHADQERKENERKERGGAALQVSNAAATFVNGFYHEGPYRSASLPRDPTARAYRSAHQYNGGYIILESWGSCPAQLIAPYTQFHTDWVFYAQGCGRVGDGSGIIYTNQQATSGRPPTHNWNTSNSGSLPCIGPRSPPFPVIQYFND